MFHRLFNKSNKSNKKIRSQLSEKTPSDNWLPVHTPDNLLSSNYRQHLIQLIWQRTSMNAALFDKLYLQSFKNLAAFLQQLPASENHHHAYAGGMLDHILEVVCFAAKMRQPYLLPIGRNVEDQSKQTEAWTAAICFAALLHDIGKIVVDIEVQLKSGKRWYVWNGQLNEPYQFRFRINRDYHLHSKIGLLLATQIIPRAALDWLSNFDELFQQLLYYLSGEPERAGVIGEIVQKADQASVAKNLGGDINKLAEQPKQSLQKQLILALRYLLQNKYKLNNQTTGSDGWLTDDNLWLISKNTGDDIRAYLLQNGITGIPHSNSRLFDELQAHKIIIANGERAIWNCMVSSDDKGPIWDKPFSLLQINPALIWSNHSERPGSFRGNITITNEPENQQSSSKSQSEQAVPSQSSTVIKNENIENFTLSLFNSLTTNTQEDDNSNVIESSGSKQTSKDEENQLQAEKKKGTLLVKAEQHPLITWINTSLRNNTLEINTANSKIHMVDNTVFLTSPGIFKEYIKHSTGNTSDDQEWRSIQKEFQKLKLHRRQSGTGINIWNCEVKGPHKTSIIKGYLLTEPDIILNGELIPNNPYLVLKGEPLK